jgi:transcriptional regulator with GAF, ATPase, and Fis domain
MGVPMVAGGKLFGLLHLENREPNAYTEEHAALAQTFANQAGIAIEKAQLYQDALRAADRRAVLHRISQDIVRFSQDSEQIYAAIHEAAWKLMPCDVFMIVLRDQARNENLPVYTVESGKRLELGRVPGTRGLAGSVIGSGMSMILKSNVEVEQRSAFHFGSSKRVQSVVAVPLRAGDEIIGMISAQSYEPYAYAASRLRHLLDAGSRQCREENPAGTEAGHLVRQRQCLPPGRESTAHCHGIWVSEFRRTGESDVPRRG